MSTIETIACLALAMVLVWVAPARGLSEPAAPGKTFVTLEGEPRPGKKPVLHEAADEVERDASDRTCTWLGKRVVNLLARDDAMAAVDFIDVYERFTCPRSHLADAFGCVVASGAPPEIEFLTVRVDLCWGNPQLDEAAARETEQPKPGAPAPAGSSPDPNQSGSRPEKPQATQ